MRQTRRPPAPSAEPQPGAPGDDPRELLWPALAFAAAVLMYARTLAYRLVWDDVPLIARNPALQEAGGWARALVGTFWGPYSRERDQADFYRPVASFSFWLDHRLWGSHAAGYHVTNVLAAAAGAALLALLLRSRGFSRVSAGLAALLFSVHPLHVESVPFISGRTDLLCLDFFLVFLWLWPRARSGAPNSPARLAAALLALLLALGSKEMALLAPLALLWEARVPATEPPQPAGPRRERPAGSGFPARMLWVLLPLALYAALRSAALAGRPSPPSGAAGGAEGVGATLLLYARLLVWPFGDSAEYSYPPSLTAPEVVAGILGWLALAAAASWPAVPCRARWAAGLAVLFALPGALPGLAAARFLYFSTAFACAALAALTESWKPSRRAVALGALAAAFAVAGWVRVPIWRSNLTLFEDCSRRAPGSPRAWINYGVSLEETGRLEEAGAALRRALALDAGDTRALSNLSLVMRKQGRYGEAESLADLAVTAEPENVDARFNRATVLQSAGRPEEAVAEYRRGLARREDPRARLGLALALSDAGDPAGALREYQAYLAAGPDDSLETRGSMAWELFRLGRVKEAEGEAREAAAAPSASALTLYNLGAILLWEGSVDEGLSVYRRALDADSDRAGWAPAAGDVVRLIREGRENWATHAALGLFAERAGLLQARAREARRALEGAPVDGAWGPRLREWAGDWDPARANEESRAEAPGKAVPVEDLRRLLWGHGSGPRHQGAVAAGR